MTITYSPSRRTTLALTTALAIIVFSAFAAPSHAQVVSDPRVAEFDPSPDHWQTLDSGQPAVVRYELGVYMCGASAPFSIAAASQSTAPPMPGVVFIDTVW